MVIDRGQALKANRVEISEQSHYLDQLRHTFFGGKAWGWYLRHRDEWKSIGRSDARAKIIALHTDERNADRNLSEYVDRSLNIVATNFGPEYPNEHEWNLYGARFAYPAADEDGETEHFDKVLTHLGSYLDRYVEADEWCQKHHIETGAQYLLLWIALMVQRPNDHLPWIFVVDPQDHEKSAFADMLGVIFKVSARSIAKASTLAHADF